MPWIVAPGGCPAGDWLRWNFISLVEGGLVPLDHLGAEPVRIGGETPQVLPQCRHRVAVCFEQRLELRRLLDHLLGHCQFDEQTAGLFALQCLRGYRLGEF